MRSRPPLTGLPSWCRSHTAANPSPTSNEVAPLAHLERSASAYSLLAVLREALPDPPAAAAEEWTEVSPEGEVQTMDSVTSVESESEDEQLKTTG